jgi:hypothetical protein
MLRYEGVSGSAPKSSGRRRSEIRPSRDPCTAQPQPPQEVYIRVSK